MQETTEKYFGPSVEKKTTHDINNESTDGSEVNY